MKPKDDIWKMFSEPFSSGDSKSKYCKCLACDGAVIAAAGRLRDHWAKCKKRPRAIGQLDAGFQPSRKSAKSAHSSKGAASTSAASSSAGGSVVDKDVMAQPLNSSLFLAGGGRQYFDSMSGEELANLQQLFARAVHRTSMPFAAFEHESWRAFFKALRGSFKIPSTEAIGGDFMRTEYALTMNDVLLHLAKHTLICFTLDGAGNVQGKQVINMMACGPKPFFLEHFTMELRRESAANLLDKLLDCKLRLLGSIRKPAPGFVLTRYNQQQLN